MSVVVTIDGVDKSASLVRAELREEYCDPGQHIELMFDQFFSVLTWKEITLTIDEALVFTGSTSQIEDASPDAVMLVRGADDIKRLREYFVAEDYETAGESVKHWVTFFAEMAGCTIAFLTDYDPVPLHGMTLSRMYAWDIIDELLLYAGWDIWCDENNVVTVGFRMSDVLPTESVTAGDNLVSLERSRDSEPPRNKAIVYSAYGSGYASDAFGWEIDESDVRTMVVASPYIQNPAEAFNLANRMLYVAGPTYDIKRCELDEIDTDIEVGDLATFDDGDGESGQDYVTSRILTVDGNTGEYSTYLKLGERCARVGAGGSPIDGRDVIVATYGFGVWRCYDIWAAGGPVWYPLNTGLTVENWYGGSDYGSSFNCEWFIRDPYKPNTLAYLLTKVGIYETQSLVSGQENWTPTVAMNYTIGPAYGGSLGPGWSIRKLRSTIAAQGQYYIVTAYDTEGWTFAGITVDNFASVVGGDYPAMGCFGTPQIPYIKTIGAPCPPRSSWLWGWCNYGHQKRVNVNSWHHYSGEPAAGGLAAWHRNNAGCSIGGTMSPHTSNGRPGVWNAQLDSDDLFPVQIRSPNIPYTIQGCPGDPSPDKWLCFGISEDLGEPPLYWNYASSTHSFELGGSASPNTKSSTPHIPYDQPMAGRPGVPAIVYWTPGEWEGDVWGTYKAWPTKGTGGTSGDKLLLPWGDSVDLCHQLQGSIGTYTPNREKVQCWSWGTPSRFAVSDNECATWEERESVPFWTSCFSGFPYSSQKVYAGRHPTQDPTSDDDRSLIYVSWDRGETWHDVTGDLWEKTQALNLRWEDGQYMGARGLVTIAPRYC